MNEIISVLLPFLCGIVVIIVGCIKYWKLRRAEQSRKTGIFGIWLMGVIALLFGIFGQLLIIVEAFDVVTQDGTISATDVARGIKNSYLPTLVGIIVMIISLVTWGILKGIKQKRIP